MHSIKEQEGSEADPLDVGMSRYVENDLDGAIETLSDVLKQVKETVSALAQDAIYYWGNAYNLKKDYDRAIADYNQAIKLKPDYAEAYYNRSWAYREKGDKSAIRDFKKVLELTKDSNLRKNAEQELKKLGAQ